jgi:hypothetical protein
VQQLERMPEFADGLGNAIGDERTWRQYHELRRRYDRLRAEGKVEQAAAMLTDGATGQVLALYRALSSRAAGKNPQATALRRANPVLRFFTIPRDEE